MHDVSWGTKGDNTVAKPLGTVTTGKTSSVEAEVPTDQKDIDTLYEDAIHVLNTKPAKGGQQTGRVDEARGLLPVVPNEVRYFWRSPLTVADLACLSFFSAQRTPCMGTHERAPRGCYHNNE